MPAVPKGRKSTTETPLGTPPPPGAPNAIDQLSFATAPRPWKDPNYRKNANRRNKTLRQIVAGERIRARQAAVKAQELAEAAAPPPPAPEEPVAGGSGDVDMEDGEAAPPAPAAPRGKSGKFKAGHKGPQAMVAAPGAGQSKKLKAAEASAGPIGPGGEADYLAYVTVEAPPSVLPPKKYCDITGLEAPYIDPKSRLRYHNAEIYELLKTFGPGTDQTYLALRGAHAMLR